MQEQTSKVLSKGANDLVKALNSLKQASTSIEAMSEEVSNLDYQISEKEKSLKQLEVNMREMERQAMLELDMKVKEGMSKHIDSFLHSTDRVAVDFEEYKSLKETKTEFNSLLATERKKITDELNAKYLSELNLKLAQINAERAEDKAALKTLETRLADSQKAADMWRTQLESEREASVERSKASSVGTINVSGSGK